MRRSSDCAYFVNVVSISEVTPSPVALVKPQETISRHRRHIAGHFGEVLTGAVLKSTRTHPRVQHAAHYELNAMTPRVLPMLNCQCTRSPRVNRLILPRSIPVLLMLKSPPSSVVVLARSRPRTWGKAFEDAVALTFAYAVASIRRQS